MRSSLSELRHFLEQRGVLHTRPAVFVDRDGTINVEKGYLRRPGDLVLLPGVGEALAQLNAHGIPVVIVTNQSALGRGLMDQAEFEAVSDALWRALRERGAYYDALYYCPHSPDGLPCDCRKPRPGLLLQAAVDLGLSLSRCFVVGDKRSDLEAGHFCGCQTILVLTGWGQRTYEEIMRAGDVQPNYVADSLLGAVRWIIDHLGTS